MKSIVFGITLFFLHRVNAAHDAPAWGYRALPSNVRCEIMHKLISDGEIETAVHLFATSKNQYYNSDLFKHLLEFKEHEQQVHEEHFVHFFSERVDEDVVCFFKLNLFLFTGSPHLMPIIRSQRYPGAPQHWNFFFIADAPIQTKYWYFIKNACDNNGLKFVSKLPEKLSPVEAKKLSVFESNAKALGQCNNYSLGIADLESCVVRLSVAKKYIEGFFDDPQVIRDAKIKQKFTEVMDDICQEDGAIFLSNKFTVSLAVFKQLVNDCYQKIRSMNSEDNVETSTFKKDFESARDTFLVNHLFDMFNRNERFKNITLDTQEVMIQVNNSQGQKYHWFVLKRAFLIYCREKQKMFGVLKSDVQKSSHKDLITDDMIDEIITERFKSALTGSANIVMGTLGEGAMKICGTAQEVIQEDCQKAIIQLHETKLSIVTTESLDANPEEFIDQDKTVENLKDDSKNPEFEKQGRFYNKKKIVALAAILLLFSLYRGYFYVLAFHTV